MYETTSQQLRDFDVHELLNDVDIGSSLDPVKVIEKNFKKMNVNILHILFIIPQKDKIKSKVEVLVKRSHALQIGCRILNHNINSFKTL